jgi:hypothetical protein
MRATLETMPTAIGALMDAHGHDWKPGSPADVEAAAFPGTQVIHTASSQAESGLIGAGDHLFALDRALTGDVMNFAPWTLARSILEHCALAAWLLAPGSACGRGSPGVLRIACKAFRMKPSLFEESSLKIETPSQGRWLILTAGSVASANKPNALAYRQSWRKGLGGSLASELGCHPPPT